MHKEKAIIGATPQQRRLSELAIEALQGDARVSGRRRNQRAPPELQQNHNQQQQPNHETPHRTNSLRNLFSRGTSDRRLNAGTSSGGGIFVGEDRKVAATTMTTTTTTTPSTEEEALPSNNNNKDRNDLDLNHHCRTRELRKQKSGRGIKSRSRSSSPPSAVPSAHSSSSGSSYGLLVPPLNIVSREAKKYTSSSKTRADQSVVVVVQADYAAYPPTNTRPAPTRHVSHTMPYDMETTKLSRFRQEASSPETPRPDCRESSRQTATVVHPDHISPTTVMDQFLNEMAEVHLEDTKISGNNPRDQSG